HESYFVGLMNLYSENAAQASTLVARAVASTKAETPTACSAAFGAMSGLEESKQLELVLPWVQEMTFATYRQKLKDMYERGYIFHGFAVQQESKNYYAKTAKKIAELLSDRQERYGALFQLAACIEEELALLGNLYPTLDYYTALSLSFLEIPAGSFSIFYAFSRITGIIAHIGEQRLSKEVLSINFPMIGFNNPSTEA
ncbi:hypothetical protein EBS02_09415, partial [bacterium]|nr:hypothetical protein [bacterium]